MRNLRLREAKRLTQLVRERAGTHTKTEVTTCILTTEVRARAAAWVAMGGAVTDDPPWTLTPC